MKALSGAVAVCCLLAPDELASTLLEERDVVAHGCGIYFQSSHPELEGEVLCSWMDLEEELSLADYREFLRAYLRGVDFREDGEGSRGPVLWPRFEPPG